MLIFLRDEVQCFDCISHLFHTVLERDFFAKPPFGLDGYRVESALLLPLAQKLIPSLTEHHSAAAASDALQVAAQCWLSLHVDCTSFGTLTVIWDELFGPEGSSALIRSLLSVLQHCAAQFGEGCSGQGDSNPLEVLREGLSQIDPDEMQQCMNSMSSAPQTSPRRDRPRCVVSVHALAAARRTARKNQVANLMSQHSTLTQLAGSTHFTCAELERLGARLKLETQGHALSQTSFMQLLAQHFPSCRPQ